MSVSENNTMYLLDMALFSLGSIVCVINIYFDIANTHIMLFLLGILVDAAFSRATSRFESIKQEKNMVLA